MEIEISYGLMQNNHRWNVANKSIITSINQAYDGNDFPPPCTSNFIFSKRVHFIHAKDKETASRIGVR